MPMFIFIGVWFCIMAAVFWTWWRVSWRRTMRTLEHLIAHPEEIKNVFRPGPDGDGYSRLHVRTKSGKTLVIGHFDADQAEARLTAAMAAK